MSRPAEFHRRPLAEPDVNLSAPPAPIKQTRRSNGLSVARIEVLLLPVASVIRPLDPTPSLQPHYGPPSLIRVGPPQCVPGYSEYCLQTRFRLVPFLW